MIDLVSSAFPFRFFLSSKEKEKRKVAACCWARIVTLFGALPAPICFEFRLALGVVGVVVAVYSSTSGERSTIAFFLSSV